MKRSFRILSLIALAAAATIASAQSPGTNPAARGSRDSFYFGSMQPRPQSTFGTPLNNNNNAIGRPMGRFGPAVTPVPEPSSWAMMLAGLALVGFMVRRNTKR